MDPAETCTITPEKLRRAQELFREFHSRCFWSWNDRAVIRRGNFSLFIDDLRTHGGRRGWKLASELCR